MSTRKWMGLGLLGMMVSMMVTKVQAEQLVQKYSDARLVTLTAEPIELIDYREDEGGALIRLSVYLNPCERFSGAVKAWASPAKGVAYTLKNAVAPPNVFCFIPPTPNVPQPTEGGVVFVSIKPGEVLYLNGDPYRFDGEQFIPPTL